VQLQLARGHDHVVGADPFQDAHLIAARRARGDELLFDDVLVRAIGPGLAQFGVGPVSARPSLSIFAGASPEASGQPWGAFSGYDSQAMGWIFQLAGAFPLQAGSNDAVFFGLLGPGAYTAQVQDSTSGAAGAAALVEVYILPFSG